MKGGFQITSKVTHYRHTVSLLLLFLAILASLSACKPQETELYFETIEQEAIAPSGEALQDEAPALIIVATPEETGQLGNLVSEYAQQQLLDMEYDNYFAVVAFLGWQPTRHEGIRVERVVRKGQSVSVFTQVGLRTGDTEVTSPYHLVKVEKSGQWDTNIDFALVIEEAKVTSQVHHIP